MKAFVIIFGLVVSGFFAQAQETQQSSLPIDDNNQVEIQIAKDTSVLILDLKTTHAVNCPKAFRLQPSRIVNGELVLKYDTQGTDAVLNMMRRVSDSCAEEILTELTAPKFTCLSFGYAHGKSLIDLRGIASELETLTVVLPFNVGLENSTQL